MKNYRFYIKLLIIFFLMLILFIPQAMLMGLISERQSWRQEAYDSIQQSWPGAQTLAGPVLSVPYQFTRTVQETIKDKDDTEREITKKVVHTEFLHIIPKQLKVTSKLSSEVRYRGIYEVPVYSNLIQVTGEFNNEELLELQRQYKDLNLQIGEPELSVLVSDQRGITNPSALKWGNSDIAFKPGVNLSGTSAGMNTKLPLIDSTTLATIPFNFNLELRGMSRMGYALLAQTSQVDLTSNWPHPKFNGELLPETRTITDQGFTATWKASSFSYNVTQALSECAQNQCSGLLSRAVGFDLLQPVDVYQQSERSVKYAVLFIVLTFVVLILFELLKSLRVHPIQYLLVGMALTVFYLLLISLSEHFDFFRAYVVAAVACVGLLTVYFGAILKSTKLGIILGAGLAVLYGVLYVILQAEDNALLMGSLLIFAMLAALMLATRHFDWYALAASMSEPKATPSRIQSDAVPAQPTTPTQE